MPVAVVQVSLAANSIRSGGTTAATATLRDSGGNALTGRSMSWSSSNTSVATVDNAGLVTGVSGGTVLIMATSEGVMGSAALTVVPVAVASVTVTTVWSTLTIGASTQVRAIARDANNAALLDRPISWSTSDANIATVTSAGLVTAVSPGTATITARSEEHAGVVTVVIVPRPQVSSTNVLMDLSHEFTFTYDIFAQWSAYWDPGYQRTTVHADLASADVDLTRYDMAIIHQSTSLVGFGDDEVERLERWVQRDGGRLVMIGRGMPDLPLARLAGRFGITFTTTATDKPYAVRPHMVTAGVTQLTTATGAPSGTALGLSVPCDTLVTDVRQQPVAIACPSGLGKVVAISDPAFIANPYQQNIINVTFMKQLMAWLGPRVRTNTAVPIRILPERTQTLSGGGRLHFTARTARSGFVGMVETQFNQIDRELQRITGLQNIFSMTFVALPCAGGGYSGGTEVGVCAFDEIGNMTLVFAHELMHSFDNPNSPPEMMHPVVSYVAAKVGDALGGRPAAVAAAERLAWDNGFRKADPTGRTLDVTNDAVFDRRGKMYWIMGRLDGTYPFSNESLYSFPMSGREPQTFLQRYFQRKRLDLSYVPTPTNIVRLLSIAACRDLFPDFRSIGTTLGPTPAGLAAEISAACR